MKFICDLCGQRFNENEKRQALRHEKNCRKRHESALLITEAINNAITLAKRAGIKLGLRDGEQLEGIAPLTAAEYDPQHDQNKVILFFDFI